MNPKSVEIFHRGQSQGKLLLSLCLLKTINKNNQALQEKFQDLCAIKKRKFRLRMSCLGLRDLCQELSEPVILFSIKSLKFKQFFGMSDKKEQEGSGKKNKFAEMLRETSNGRNVNIMETADAVLSLPVNRFFWPFLDIQIFDRLDSSPRFFCSNP